MDTLRGTVERIIYTNSTNTYCVFRIIDADGDDWICTGNLEAPKTGDDLEITGRFILHPKYGEQFTAESIEKVRPDSLGGVKQYLINLGVKGLGEKTIDKLMDYFEDELVEILKQADPVEILEVPHVRKSVKEDLYKTLRGEGFLADINRFLEKHGISAKWSRLLYDTYQSYAIATLEENPYRLLVIDESITFKVADTLAMSLEFPLHSRQRIEAAVFYTLRTLPEEGHTCYPYDELIGTLYNLLGGYADEIAQIIDTMLENHQLHGVDYEGMYYIYPLHLYDAEFESANRTLQSIEAVEYTSDFDRLIRTFEQSNSIELGDKQKEAILMALTNGLSVITGGPGTGKTTIIKALVEAFQWEGKSKIILCAPTGRAAKRLSEAARYDAYTIHRLLIPEQGGGEYTFVKNEDNPLEAEVVIIDEASMLNIQLYHALMRAIPESAQCIIVGDVDQLPPIGAGFVLRDILQSEVVPSQRLEEIYRQARGNRIIDNAYLINEGEFPILDESPEFEYIPVTTVRETLQSVVEVYNRELACVEDPLDVQIISPMRKGNAGSTALSRLVQDTINGPAQGIGEIKVDGIVYRVGDKVIQVQNNYDLEVYNGEIGIIYAISKNYMLVRFTEKEVQLTLEDIPLIMPAYAITVHKAQGSEYGTVIIPFIPVYHNMLQRNLLYTAITRARHKVVIIGTKKAILQAVQTKIDDTYYTLFKERLLGKV